MAASKAKTAATEDTEETHDDDIEDEQPDEIGSPVASAGPDSDAEELGEHDSDGDVDDKVSTEVAETEVARGTAPPNAQRETNPAAAAAAKPVVVAHVDVATVATTKATTTTTVTEQKAVSAKKPSKPKAAKVVAPVAKLASKPKNVDDEGIEIDESDVVVQTEREKKLVEDAIRHTTVSMTYEDVVEYAFASKATFTLVIMALMMQEYSKKCQQDYKRRLLQRAVESEDAVKNTQIGDVSNPHERPVRIQQILDEAAESCKDRKLLAIAAGAGKNQLLSPTTSEQVKSAKSDITMERKKEALKKAAEKKAADKKAGKKVVPGAADTDGKLPFWMYHISDQELLRDGEGEPLDGASKKKHLTNAELDELRAVARATGACKKPMPSKKELDDRRTIEIERRKIAGAKNADLLAARHKLSTAERLRNDHEVLRTAIRRSLVRVDVASLSPYLPLRGNSNDIDYAAVADFYLMPMLGSVPGGDARSIMSQCTTVWKGFFLPHLIEAMVRLKETMILVQGRPLTDLLAVGHYIEDRCTKTGSKTLEVREKFQATKDKLAVLQVFLVKSMDQPEELAKHAKLFFGREPPLDWCRFRLSPLFVDENGQPQHPEPPASRQKRKSRGKVVAADADDADDDADADVDDGDEDDGDADGDADAATPVDDGAKATAKRQRVPAPVVAATATVAAVAAVAAVTKPKPVRKRAPPKAKPVKSVASTVLEAEEATKKMMQLDAPEKSASTSSDAPAKLTTEDQYKLQAELGAASALKTPMHARFAEGLLFSNPQQAPDERIDALFKNEGVEPLVAHMTAKFRFRTLAATAAANAVPAHESRTTSLSAGAAAKKRNARKDGDSVNDDDDSGEDEDAPLTIDALDDLANGKGVTKEDGLAEDSTIDAEEHIEINIRPNDMRFIDIIASQCGIRKKRIEHLFVKLTYPVIAASIEKDWSVRYDGESAVVPLALNDEETARVAAKLLQLRQMARVGHAKKRQGIQEEANATANHRALTLSNQILPTPPPPTPLSDAETRKLKKALTAAANSDGSAATRAILTSQSSRDPRPERAILATVPGAAGSGSKVSMQPSTVMMELLHTTDDIDEHKVMQYGQLYELQKHVAAGTTTSEERLALMHTLSHFDAYASKMMWLRFKGGLIRSNINPNNFMLAGRLISQSETGFTVWLADCMLMKSELARTVACMCYKPDGKFWLPPVPLLDNDFTPFVNWAPGAPVVFAPAIENRREFYTEMEEKMHQMALAAIKDPRGAADALLAAQDAAH